jgi:hypothetical protein
MNDFKHILAQLAPADHGKVVLLAQQKGHACSRYKYDQSHKDGTLVDENAHDFAGCLSSAMRKKTWVSCFSANIIAKKAATEYNGKQWAHWLLAKQPGCCRRRVWTNESINQIESKYELSRPRKKK